MSLPPAYSNPDVFPCGGSYTWVPPYPPNIGNLNATIGFENLIIDRGKFRNYSVSTNGSSNINVSSGVDPQFIQGSLYSPIINATRPLAIRFSVKKSKNNNVVVVAQGSNDLIIFENMDSISGTLSCVQIEYDLSFWVQDEKLLKYNLTSKQLSSLESMQNNGVDNNNLSIFLSGLNPNVIKIIGVDSSGVEIELPIDIIQKGLQITRLRNVESESGLDLIINSADSPANGPTFFTQTIKIKQEILDRNAFPNIKKVILRVNENFGNSTLTFILKKIMFFSADRVNFRFDGAQKQLPCNAIGYSMFVNGTWYPALAYLGGFGVGSLSNSFVWPQDSRLNGTNIHVKIFNPESRYHSEGFAHSLNLHIFIVAFPLFGPLGELLLPGVVLPWMGIILGPTGFTKQYTFVGTSNVNDIHSQLAVLSSPSFKQSSGDVTLLKDNNSVFNKKIESYKNTINASNNFYNTYEYIADNTNNITQFQNLYRDSFGIETRSSIYKGVPIRSEQYHNAYDLVPPGKINKKQYTYQSYVILNDPSIVDIFENSEPCLIFKLNTLHSTNIFQEAGLLSASINCYVTDKVGLFDTKLVYRIYAVNKNSSTINPKSNKKHTLKIFHDSEESPSIKFDNFDSTWDFNNVLVSANIENILQPISTEEIINSTQKTFIISDQDFDLYCAIYCFSVQNDSVNQYDVTNVGALDFPVINFSLESNFLLSLPIYYRISPNNGGTLQAQRDFGYTGEYTKDLNQYTIYDQYYSGSEFDNTFPYDGKLNFVNGYDNLLVLSADVLSDKTNFDILIDSGSNNNPFINETDFILISENLENCKVAVGTWELNIELNQQLNNNALFKFEIDLIDAEKYTLVCKIISSKYSKDLNMKVDINIPFYLSGNNTIIILKLFVKNVSDPFVLSVKSIVLKSNTLEYFAYKDKTSATGVPINFYEDLPVQPTSYIGNCNEFFFKLDFPPAGFVVFDPVQGLYINGALYSPTWKADLSEKLELDYRGVINSSLIPRATGVQPYQIFFRTGTSSPVRVIDTKKHKSTNLIVTLTNEKTNFSDNAVAQIVSESYARFLRQQSNLKTVYANDNVVELELQNPIMASSDELLISGQIERGQSIKTVTLNMESPGTFAIQPEFTGLFAPIDDDGYVRTKLYKCSFVSFDSKGSKTFSAGVTANGNLIYVEDSIISSDQSIQFKLIEGDPNSSELTDPKVYIDNTNYYGLVSKGYVGILATLSDDIIILYVYGSSSTNISNYAIYMRIINGAHISDPILIFSFNDYFESQNIFLSPPPINQISMTRNDIFEFGNEFYAAFDCGNKVFFFKLLYDQKHATVLDLAIIYGNLILSNDNNDQKFIDGLNLLINKGLLNKLSFSTQSEEAIYSNNLDGSQRVGLIDFDGVYIGVQFLDSNKIMEVVFDKSYAIPAELREIGTILG